MRVKDLIDYAGGLLMQAYLEEAEITRVTVTPQGPETSRLYVNLRQAMNGTPRDNILLRPNDYVFIRSIPDWSLYKLVKVEGEVKYPGNYAIKKGETLSSLLTRAGGFSDNAYPKGAYFTRRSVQKMQGEHLRQALDKLEAEMLSVTILATQTAVEREDVERFKTVGLQQQQFLAKLRTIQPLGRVVINLDDPERLRGTPDDLELQEGDNLLIPQIQQTVNVLGSVVNPSAVVYDPYLTVKKYVAQVGGPTKNADMDRVYVVKVNGSALGGKGGIILGSRVASTRLDPGDTIIVPENLERTPWLRTIKEVTSILGNIALTAGVVLVGLR
jgi:polysaccharide biosynthesis/export protein